MSLCRVGTMNSWGIVLYSKVEVLGEKVENFLGCLIIHAMFDGHVSMGCEKFKCFCQSLLEGRACQ
jgi:hypothetical protein